MLPRIGELPGRGFRGRVEGTLALKYNTRTSEPSASLAGHAMELVDDHTNAQLRLSIWRDFTVTHPLVIHDEQSGLRIVNNDSGTLPQAEVYSWRLPQEPFAGIEDEKVRKNLHETLHERLHVSRPPATRDLTALCDFIAKAERTIADGSAGPIPSGVPSKESPDGYALEPNPLLALVLHLKWLVRCFRDRPGMSVSIR